MYEQQHLLPSPGAGCPIFARFHRAKVGNRAKARSASLGDYGHDFTDSPRLNPYHQQV